MFLDVVDGVLHAADFLRVLVGDVDLEGLLEGQHELHEAERIGSQIVDERGLRLDLSLVDVELLLDDAPYLSRDVATVSHALPPNRRGV